MTTSPKRFKHEEKLLGPNEQAAVDYVIALLAADDKAGGEVVAAQRRVFDRGEWGPWYEIPLSIAGGSYRDVVQTRLLYTRPQPQAAQPAERVACNWQLTDDDNMVYESACGEAWVFNDGGPKENNVRFCQGCGKPVNLLGITAKDQS